MHLNALFSVTFCSAFISSLSRVILALDNCLSNPCLNKATCQNGFNTFSCNCISGYTGTTCSISKQSNMCVIIYL